jgi:ergothioneine biosynthesis protein EgtB
VLGTHHEEQHQELLLTDVKPLLDGRAITRSEESIAGVPRAGVMCPQDGGLVEIGRASDAPDFAFDNETPRNRVWVEPFELADRCVTAREYLAFVEAGGYRTPALWLSDGWAAVNREGWTSPMYWERTDDGWSERTLAGRMPLRLDAPVCHVSYFEADAYARFAGARLPSEAEWELVASRDPVDGNFVESGLLRPATSCGDTQRFGDVWEWTSSAYAPYPRYRPFEGAFAEYNGKFMCSQLVLRGGSCLTPRAHVRATYRNFFGPAARWQMSGLRLARWRDA